MTKVGYLISALIITLFVPVHGVETDKCAVRYRTVCVCRVPQVQGAGHADVFFILQVPGNKADAVPCERILLFY